MKRKREEYSNQQLQSKSKPELIGTITRLTSSKNAGWFNYYQTVDHYENCIRSKRKKIVDLQEQINKFQENTEIKLPDFLLKMANDGKDAFECPCCKDDLELITDKEKYLVSVCGHFFCRECFKKWTGDRSNPNYYRCPTCRSQIIKKYY